MRPLDLCSRLGTAHTKCHCGMQGSARGRSSPAEKANGSHATLPDPVGTESPDGAKPGGASVQPHAASAAGLAAAKAHLELEQNPAELLVKAAEEAAAARAVAAGKASADGHIGNHRQNGGASASSDQLKSEPAEADGGQPDVMDVDGETPASPGASSRKRSRQGSDQLEQGGF